MTTNFSSVDYSSVEAVYPQIQKRAAWLAFRFGLDADDLAQQMALRLCERVAAGTLADAPAEQLMAHAQFVGKNCKRSDDRYRRIVAEEIVSVDPSATEILFELIPDEGVSPEGRLVKMESAERLGRRVQLLSPSNRTVVKLLLVGFSKSEIAERIGCTRPALSHRLDVIAQVVRGGAAQ